MKDTIQTSPGPGDPRTEPAPATLARATRRPVTGWAKIEADDIRDSRLSPTAFKLLALLLAQARGREYAVMSVAQIAEQLDRSERMVQYAIGQLEDLRYVSVIEDNTLAVGRRFYLRFDQSRAAGDAAAILSPTPPAPRGGVQPIAPRGATDCTQIVRKNEKENSEKSRPQIPPSRERTMGEPARQGDAIVRPTAEQAERAATDSTQAADVAATLRRLGRQSTPEDLEAAVGMLVRLFRDGRSATFYRKWVRLAADGTVPASILADAAQKTLEQMIRQPVCRAGAYFNTTLMNAVKAATAARVERERARRAAQTAQEPAQGDGEPPADRSATPTRERPRERLRAAQDPDAARRRREDLERYGRQLASGDPILAPDARRKIERIAADDDVDVDLAARAAELLAIEATDDDVDVDLAASAQAQRERLAEYRRRRAPAEPGDAQGDAGDPSISEYP